MDLWYPLPGRKAANKIGKDSHSRRNILIMWSYQRYSRKGYDTIRESMYTYASCLIFPLLGLYLRINLAQFYERDSKTYYKGIVIKRV